jgi:uncharacterized protein (TIGR02265 family)
MDGVSVSVDLASVAASLDLERRLRSVPSSACSRGIFFNMLRQDLDRRNLLALPEVRRLLNVPRKSYRFYPTRELLEVYALGGALVDSDPREGMRHLFTDTANYFSNTWYGAAFARFLNPDPASALAYIERSREHVANYGRWRLERRGPGHAILHMFDEYFWIEAAQRGGCEGLLVACGVTGEVHAELDSEFDGRLDIRWQLRN